VVHQSQRLLFRLEAGNDLACVHSGLDDLDRHLAPDRFPLFGHPHLAEPANANSFEKFVAGHPRAGASDEERIWRRGEGRDLRVRDVGAQPFFQVGKAFRIPRADFLEKRPPFRWRHAEGASENRILVLDGRLERMHECFLRERRPFHIRAPGLREYLSQPAQPGAERGLLGTSLAQETLPLQCGKHKEPRDH